MSDTRLPHDEETILDTESLVGVCLEERFDIKEAFDAGGMGSVFKAWDRTLNREVVVKMPHPNLMRDERFRLRFLDEVRDLSRYEHPSILKINASGEYRNLPYAVVQYLSGGNLSQKIQELGGKMSAEEIMEWLPSIADALDYVHREGCLHRDIKPANILFDHHGHPFLADFGIATAIGKADPDAPTEVTADPRTVVGTFIGSPAYAPPEAIDREHSPAYDQYSLATVVYLALCGELPFTGKTNEQVLVNKTKINPPPLELEDPTISVQVSQPEAPRQVPACQFEHPFHRGSVDHSMSTLIDAPYPSALAAYFALVGQIDRPVVRQATRG